MKPIKWLNKRLRRLLSAERQKSIIEYRNECKEERKRNWSQYNESQKKEKILFQQILDELCDYLPETKTDKVGRKPMQMRDMVFSMGTKVYERVSSRRLDSDLVFSKDRRFLEHIPASSTTLKYFNDTTLTKHLIDLIHLSSLPLRGIEKTFAVDATGISSAYYSRWMEQKFKLKDGAGYWMHDWLKLHLVCGVASHIVTHVVVTDARAHDAPHFKELVETTAQNGFAPETIVADKGYTSRLNSQIVEDIGAVPILPPRRGTTGLSKGFPAFRKMFYFFQTEKDKFYEIYHQRSNIESLNSSLKRIFGGKLMLRNPEAQVNEALLMVLCHNIRCLIRATYETDLRIEFERELEKSAHLFPDLSIYSAPPQESS